MPAYAIVFFASGLSVGLIIGAIGWRYIETLRERNRRDKATIILKEHGLTPVIYVPTYVPPKPGDLETVKSALHEFTFKGYLVMNNKGRVIGKIKNPNGVFVDARLIVKGESLKSG